jgi:hypothetical protein
MTRARKQFSVCIHLRISSSSLAARTRQKPIEAIERRRRRLLLLLLLLPDSSFHPRGQAAADEPVLPHCQLDCRSPYSERLEQRHGDGRSSQCRAAIRQDVDDPEDRGRRGSEPGLGGRSLMVPRPGTRIEARTHLTISGLRPAIDGKTRPPLARKWLYYSLSWGSRTGGGGDLA